MEGESARSDSRNPHGDGRYIPILDGWRAVAITLVLLFHGLFNSDLADDARLHFAATLAGRLGALGVLVFFAISGYLITHRLLVESRRMGMFSLRSFYIKRAFRILPPLLVYLAAIGALALAGVLPLQRRDWLAPLFLANYFQGSWYTSHFWSLSVEEHFYLFWPLCVVLAGWRRAMWIGLPLIAAVAIWRPWVVAHTPPGAALAAVLQHTDMRVDYILMGAVVALVVEFYPAGVRWLKRCGSGWGLLALLALLLLSTRPAPLDLRSVQAMLLTLIVCGSAVADAPLPRALLTSRPVLFVGKVSYSLYVWQQLVLAPTHAARWSSPYALPAKYGVALLLAYGSYRFVERPFIRMGRRLIDREPEPGASL